MASTETDEAQATLSDLNGIASDEQERDETETDTGSETGTDASDTESETETETGTETDNSRIEGDYLALCSAMTKGDLLDPIRYVLAAARDETGAGLDADERGDLASGIAVNNIEIEGVAARVRGGAVTWDVRPSRNRIESALAEYDECDAAIDVLVVDKLETIGDSPASIRETIDLALSNDWEVYIVRGDVRLAPGSDAAETVLDLLLAQDRAGIDLRRETGVADIERRLSGDREHHGRAPLGFDVVDGKLVPADNHDTVREVLTCVDRDPSGDKMSKGEAARRLDTTRRTINRALRERREMYGLDG